MFDHEFPGGKRFAFTILDDTDGSTLENTSPVYRLLDELGMRTTKTVWPLAYPEGGTNFDSSATLDDDEYRAFVVDLQHRGFEITWHAATMASSPREFTVKALERFHEVFGSYPRIHTSHSANRENPYWGPGRFDDALLRRLSVRIWNTGFDFFQGHVEDSPYWWGDLCERHITYGRNLTFNDIDTADANPSMPYHDPRRPLVRWWFSCSDAEDAEEFAVLLHPRNQEALERQGGWCIVATHFGKGFSNAGHVHTLVEERLRMLARRAGWFVPVGTLLDHLRNHRSSDELPRTEWRRMQWRWARDMAVRQIRRRLRRLGVPSGARASVLHFTTTAPHARR